MNWGPHKRTPKQKNSHVNVVILTFVFKSLICAAFISLMCWHSTPHQAALVTSLECSGVRLALKETSPELFRSDFRTFWLSEIWKGPGFGPFFIQSESGLLLAQNLTTLLISQAPPPSQRYFSCSWSNCNLIYVYSV